MTDQPSNIVPFGKYKGRLIEEVLVDDPGYLQWLAGQEWFRNKFAVLYQVIINRGAEAEETPDHNAMQVKFLDDDFCVRFLRCYQPDLVHVAHRKLQGILDLRAYRAQTELDATKETLKKAQDDLRRHTEMDASRGGPYAYRPWRSPEDLRSEIEKLVGEIPALETGVALLRAAKIDAIEFPSKRSFEDRGVDVVLLVYARWASDHDVISELWELYGGEDSARGVAIELKPVVGDDYPAVLRQMKANGSGVLFVGEYTGQGATEEQFVKTMATAGIRVIFASDVKST